MRISVVRTGGVAGVRRAAELDTAALPADVAAEAEALAGRLVAALEAGGPAGRSADRFRYEVTVEADGAAVRRVSASEGALAPASRTALARLQELAAGIG